LAIAGRTGLATGGATVWNVSSGKIVQQDKLAGHAVALSGDGRYLAGDSGHGFTITDLQTRKVVWDASDTTHFSCVNNLAFTSDGKFLVTSSGDDTVKVWNAPAKTLQAIFFFNSRRVYGSPWRVHYPDLKNGDPPPENAKVIAVMDGDIPQGIYQFSFSPDDKSIAIALGIDNVKILEITTGKLLKSFRTDVAGVVSVRFSNDGKLLVIGGALKKGKIELWNVEEGKRLLTLPGHTDSVLHVAISPDNKTILSGGVIDGARVWDVDTGKQKSAYYQAEQTRVVGLGFFPDGKTFYTLKLARGSAIDFWDTATGKQVTLPRHK
jgi:WD40 repeat protein